MHVIWGLSGEHDGVTFEILGSLRMTLGSLWDDFGSLWDDFGVTFGIILEALWDDVGVTFGSF